MEGFQSIMIGLISLIPKLFYLLTMSILGVIDFFQFLFRKLAGLDCYYVDGTAQTGDIVYDFLTGILFGQYPILSNVFLGLIILGFILLFLSTFVAIIRNEYTTDKAENSKGKIIGKAFKSVIYFAIVPVVCLFGVYLANIVLVAVDSASTYNTNYGTTLDTSKLQSVNVASQTFGTGSNVQQTYITYNLFGITDSSGLPFGTTTTTFSGTVFKAAAYSANRIRLTANNEDQNNFGYLIKTGQVTNFNELFSDPSGNVENIAMKIDIAFADNVVFKKAEALNFNSDYARINNDSTFSPFGSSPTTEIGFANKYDVNLVWYYYDLWSFNYIIGLGAAIVMATIFINIIFGLMRRIIELIGLFLMAPPLIALMPLDNEKAYGAWRGSFIKKVLMAYGAVGGMNLVFLILPELQTISFFNIAFLDWLTNTILVLVALLAVKDFIGVVSGFAGGENANQVGEGVAKDVGDLAAKAGKLAATTIGVGAGATMMAARGAMVAGSLAASGLKAGVKGAKTLGSAASGALKYSETTGGLGTAMAPSATYDARMAKSDTHMKEATDEVFAKYKVLSEPGVRMTTSSEGLSAEEYEAKVQSTLRQNFERDKNEVGLGHTKSWNQLINESYAEKQSKVVVTNQEVYNDTSWAKRRAESAERKAERKAEGISEWQHFKTTAGQKASSATQFVKEKTLYVTSPFNQAITNMFNMSISTVGDNKFTSELRGKDNEHIRDIGYRILGTTLKAHEKDKEKEASKQKAEKEQKEKIDTIVKALKELEKSKKEDAEK